MEATSRMKGAFFFSGKRQLKLFKEGLHAAGDS